MHFDDRGIPHFKIATHYPTSEAIKNHPDLIPFLKTRHPPRIDNENRALLFKYNQYIAQDLYQLEIEFASTAIIPTPVMRYHFLKHVIQPMPSSQCLEQISMIEIGTGASAIIALLAAKHFQARVYATEIDQEYLHIAQRNISRNHLDSLITLIPSEGQIINGLFPEDLKVDYIVSNPPYYDKILSPKVIWGGKKHELVSQGESGEEFIIRMVGEGLPFLKSRGVIAFIIPKTRISTLISIETFLNQNNYDYEILALLVGNRTRYIFKIYKNRDREPFPEIEM